MSERNTSPRLTHRQRQAQATRNLIVQAAADSFLETGYAGTTMEAIALRAGVAVSTVYSTFTNKRTLLAAIREAWHRATGQRDTYRLAGEQAHIGDRLRLAAHATRRQWELGARMMTIYTAAAASDPEAAQELGTALQGRRTNIGRIVGAWAEDFQLDAPRFSAAYLALTRAEVYLELVGEFGWTPDAYEAWLLSHLNAEVELCRTAATGPVLPD
ncbi:TetR/AcrR family transcriptional regulator [uncultured Deinococcus sp.]|uniref:TetR/AcrR family transcriptional regulator n=1 Tax=uncultured Deinococcus sp. TaxID=158789 RepID=UPI0025D0468E|nr:TetR/AcrR family transcriptional regulator [uncultured Deinococcus sp.]